MCVVVRDVRVCVSVYVLVKVCVYMNGFLCEDVGAYMWMK